MKDELFTVLIYIGIALIIVLPFALINATINQLTYGDWTCMFKQCVAIKEGGE